MEPTCFLLSDGIQLRRQQINRTDARMSTFQKTDMATLWNGIWMQAEGRPSWGGLRQQASAGNGPHSPEGLVACLYCQRSHEGMLLHPSRRRWICEGRSCMGIQSLERWFFRKLQKAWEEPYTIVKRINDIVYRIRRVLNGKPKVVVHHHLLPFRGDDSDSQEAWTVTTAKKKPSYDEFRELMVALEKHDSGSLAKKGETCMLYQVWTLEEKFLASLIRNTDDSKIWQHLWWKRPLEEAVRDLRWRLVELNVDKLTKPEIDWGYNGLDWWIVCNVPEVIFKDTRLKILICSYNLQVNG